MFRRACFILFCLMLSLAHAGHAHELRPAILSLVYSDTGGATLAIDMNVEAALAGIGAEHSDTTDAPEAALYDRLRAQDPEDLIAQIRSDTFDAPSLVTLDDATLTLRDLDVPAVGDIALPRHSILTFDVSGLSGETARMMWNGASSAAIVRVDGAAGEQLHSEFLQSGGTTAAFPVQTGAPQGLWSVFANYLVVGFEHIIPKGLDHILFVVGLFLLSTRVGPLLWQVTAFTLAHTVTLALGTLGLVSIPASIVEPLIALSIVYVCVENIAVRQMTPWRPAIVFAFGLLHGLGFAGVLGEVGLSGEFLLTSLIAFNIGVEIGQLLVIAICMMLVGIWFGTKSWYRSVIVVPGSLIVGSIGLFWFVERIGFV
ncbi:HupE/UreJ family protein [Pontivivens insulae]|uniref:HupE / UreJ protein n=1 Tax=Pontivivens insulae TaxID=1639689 RepID=A0A2R8A6L1_9RHOB|nr:HupE/UreJ family protein [Pontivivens insulae]RED17974.1 HupE/UreJ protein [Pontivivens insulae]SPF27863.1 hypothetical protein POI8812_00158 [Pontivivens insulae]